MKKSILCPIDFSESSIRALQYAINLAKKDRSGITVLYSFRLIQSPGDEGVVTFKKKMENDARERFTSLEKFFENDRRIDHQFIVEVGFFPDSIAGQVRKNSVSKIVIDKEMYPLINESLNDHRQPVESLLNALNIPVIVVPQKALCE